MKSIEKKILAGTIASFLLGGGFVAVLQSTDAKAADTQTPAVQSDAGSKAPGKGQGRGQGPGEHRGGGDFRGNGMMQSVAAAIGIDEASLMSELKQGKTVAQVAKDKAGLAEDALLQKLTAAENKRIDDAVAAGKLTQAQADTQKAGLADHLKQFVQNAKQGEFRGGMEHLGPWGTPDAIAKIVGITAQELTTQLQAGKSLAEIADTKGISKDQLISKLKDNATEELTRFVDRKGTQDGKSFRGPKPSTPGSVQSQ